LVNPAKSELFRHKSGLGQKLSVYRHSLCSFDLLLACYTK
jgi:hypothetical protein